MVQRALLCAGVLAAAAGVVRAQLVALPLSLRPVLLADVPATAPAGSEERANIEGTHAPVDESVYGLLGSGFGFRDKLAESHIYVGGYVWFDAARVLRGVQTHNTPLYSLFDAHVLVDANAMGLTGGTAYFDFQSHWQSNSAEITPGDIQGYDNLVGPEFQQIAQLWYRQALGDFRIKLGKIDANTDAAADDLPANDGFSLIEHGLDFLHSAAAFPAAMVPLASYPIPLPGVELFYGKEEGPYAGVGAFYSTNAHQNFLNFGGNPQHAELTNGGVFIVAETGHRWTWQNLPGHAAVGGWFLSGVVVETDTRVSGDTGGGYAFFDQSLFHEEPRDGPTRDIGFFLNAALSNKYNTPIDASTAGGIMALGFVPGRPEDAFGVLGAWAGLPAAGLPHGFEANVEVFYKLKIINGLNLKPDFQYIFSPSGREPDAAVITLRAEVTF